ncbi:MAG: hypothetical protein IJX47_00770 [Clostridia bacterium]|nr:hypothetical protein [Clostridia bacterium]
MKKKILVVLSLLLIAAMAITGTVAYLTDEESDVNVMTVGNVSIKQHEYERAVDENGNYISADDTDDYGYTPDELKEFEQDKPIVPAVYDTIMWDDRNGSQDASGEQSHQQSWGQVGAPGSNQLFDADMGNVIDKFVFVENDGKSDAYYRTIIAIECPEGLNPDLIHLNVNGNSRFTWSDIGYITLDGVQYFLKVAQYNEVLTPGEVSRPSLLQVFLDKEATNDDMALFGEKMEILVVSQAVQADGWADKDGSGTAADDALNTAFYPVTTGTHPWVDSVTVSDTDVTVSKIINTDATAITVEADSATNNVTVTSTAIYADTLLEADKDIWVMFDGVEVTADTGMIFNNYNTTLILDGGDFTIADGVLATFTSGGQVVYVTAPVTVNGTEITAENYSEYLVNCLVFFYY